MSDAQADGGVEGVGAVVPTEPLRPVGGAQDGGDAARRRPPAKPTPQGPTPASPGVPPAPVGPGRRIDEQA